MRIDLLDVQFRFETVFGLQLEREFFPDLFAKQHPNWKMPGQPRPAVTVGQISEELLKRLRHENRLEGDYSQLRALTLSSVVDSLPESLALRKLTAETPVTKLVPPPLNRQPRNRLTAMLNVEPPSIPWSPLTIVSYGGGCLVHVVLLILNVLLHLPGKYLLFAALGLILMIF